MLTLNMGNAVLLHEVARSTTLQIISRDFFGPPQGPQWPDLALLRTVGSYKNMEGVSCNQKGFEEEVSMAFCERLCPSLNVFYRN